MSQYDSRIFIKVKSPEIWNRFEDEDVASFRLHYLVSEGRTSFEVGDDCWGCEESSLYEIVNDIAKQLGQDGFVIADTYNCNVDPYNACYYYFGGRVNQDEVSIYNNEARCDMHSKTSISDVVGWLNYGELSVTDKEEDFLFSFGILVSPNKGKFNYSYDSGASDVKYEKIYLRETSFGDRPDRIEKIKISDSIELISSPDKQNDPSRLAVKCLGGTIGYLPSKESESLSSYMGNKFYELEGRISEIIPSSKRNKYSKSSKIAIDVFVTKTNGKKKKDKIESKEINNSRITGLTFVVTGDLETFACRNDLKELIEEHGGKLTGSVSSKTDYLITNTPNSGTTKNRTAQSLGVPIITEKEFLNLLEE